MHCSQWQDDDDDDVLAVVMSLHSCHPAGIHHNTGINLGGQRKLPPNLLDLGLVIKK